MNPNQEEQVSSACTDGPRPLDQRIDMLEDQVIALASTVNILAQSPKPAASEAWVDSDKEHGLLMRAQRKLAEAESQRVLASIENMERQTEAEIDVSLREARSTMWVNVSKIAMWLSLSALMLTVAYHVS